MSYTSEREAFIARMIGEGLDLPTIRKVLRHANTIQRLSCAECNGDYPCDNGERKVEFCSECESGYVPTSLKGGVCPNCRAQHSITAALPAGFGAVYQGDPRGACVKLTVPSGKTDDMGREGLCVPTHNY